MKIESMGMRARALKQGSRRGKVSAKDEKSRRQKEKINKEKR